MDNKELITEAHKRVRGLTAIAERGGDPWIRVDAAAARTTIRLLIDALEAAEAELTRRDTVIAEARTANHFSPIKNYRVDEILAAAPVSLEAAHDSECEADWGIEGQESPCRCNARSLEAVKAETTTEWGVRWTQVEPPAVTDRGADEADVRRLVQALPDESEVVVREVTEWRPVSTEWDTK